jgi:integrase
MAERQAIDERQTSDGPRFDVRFRVNGAQRKKTFRSRDDANKYLDQLRADAHRGLVIDPRGGERLFGPFAETWLDERLVKGEPLTPATRNGYEKLLRRTIYPTFEKTRLRQIDSEAVRKWYAKLTKSKSGDQAAKSYRLLRAILNTALSDRLIPFNPCVIKGAGIERARERPMLETGDVLKLADAISDRLRALILLAGFAALRAGELLGLQRRDIDLMHGTVTVSRQAHEITGQGRILTRPKSEAGSRKVPLPPIIADEISEHLDKFVGAAPDSPLFTRSSGLPLRRADLSEAWGKAVAEVGVPDGLHLHDLRHHAATVYARKPGITLKELMTIIGHASPVAALRYQHSTEEREREIADFMNEAITAAKSAPKSKTVRLRS